MYPPVLEAIDPVSLKENPPLDTSQPGVEIAVSFIATAHHCKLTPSMLRSQRGYREWDDAIGRV